MRAADFARRLFVQATPMVVAHSEEAWDTSSLVAHLDADLRRFWDSRAPGSGAPECLMAAALQSLENKGYRLPRYDDLLERGLRAVADGDMETLHRVTIRLRGVLRSATPDPSHPSQRTIRYATWEAFDDATPWPDDAPVDLDAPEFARAIEAAWRAQLVGGAVGTAIEGYTAEAIAAAFGPIRDYVRPPNTYNDDITFELAFLEAFAAHGLAVTSQAIGEEWVALVPFGWSAEGVALDNLRRGVAPPDSGVLDNPFDEWIGAQMRGATCGMVVPGRAREAARLAWLDARISHAGNGILGEVFNAVLAARAFVERDMRALLLGTIALFDPRTEYGAAVHEAAAACREHADWRAAWAACEARYVDYNWVHVLPNAAAQVVALWFGQGEFDRTLEVACGVGHDVDCNAAQVLTAIGIMHGPGAIAARWTDPLGEEIATTMRRPARMPLSDLVARTVEAARRWR